MTGLSSTWEDKVLQQIATDGVYVGLHSADEGNEPDGSFEIEATDYQRIHLMESEINISGEAPTILSNDVEIEWGEAEEDWGEVTHGVLWSADLDGVGEPYTSSSELTNGGTVAEGVAVSIGVSELEFKVN